MDDLIRASVVEIVRSDELQDYVDQGVLESVEHVYTVKELANKILSHRCTQRCVRRIGDGEGPENFKCRKPDYLKMSPDNTRNCHIPLPSNISSDCKDVLVKIGLAEKPVVNKYGYESEFKSSCRFFHPTRHIPPTNPVDYSNISPVEGKTFCCCQSMQNIQWLTTSGGLNKYICKYIGKNDEITM